VGLLVATVVGSASVTVVVASVALGGRSRNYIIDCHGALLVAKKKKMWIDTTGHDHKLKDVDKSKKNTTTTVVTDVETSNATEASTTVTDNTVRRGTRFKF
jgi:hypothetical protein